VKSLVTDQVVLTVNYDAENITDPERRKKYRGETVTDRYGRTVPKHAHGTQNIGYMTSATDRIIEAALAIYDREVNRDLYVRYIYVIAGNVIPKEQAESRQAEAEEYEQMDLFTDYKALEKKKEAEKAERDREKKVQQALMDIKKKYGKNAIVRGLNMQEGATGMERNAQIGGHKA
jgi:DNA polymerase V